jgi:hypothetical protein
MKPFASSVHRYGPGKRKFRALMTKKRVRPQMATWYKRFIVRFVNSYETKKQTALIVH